MEMKTACRILGWIICRKKKHFVRPGIEIFILKAINREEVSDVRKCTKLPGTEVKIWTCFIH